MAQRGRCRRGSAMISGSAFPGRPSHCSPPVRRLRRLDNQPGAAAYKCDVEMILRRSYAQACDARGSDPSFRHLLARSRTRRAWVELPGRSHNHRTGWNEQVAAFPATALAGKLGSGRLLRSSSWLHTCLKQSETRAAVRQAFSRWIFSEANQRAVLRCHAARAFRLHLV